MNRMECVRMSVEEDNGRDYGLQMTHFRLGSFFLRWVFV